jgi:hypothetical protein
MQTAPLTAFPATSKTHWTGRVMSATVAVFLLFDSLIKIAEVRPALEATSRLGYPPSLVFGLGLVELVCTVVYILPRTAVVGAILLTAYLGGATASHVRAGDPFVVPIVFGVVIWVGLFLRHEGVRALLLGDRPS